MRRRDVLCEAKYRTGNRASRASISRRLIIRRARVRLDANCVKTRREVINRHRPARGGRGLRDTLRYAEAPRRPGISAESATPRYDASKDPFNRLELQRRISGGEASPPHAPKLSHPFRGINSIYGPLFARALATGEGRQRAKERANVCLLLGYVPRCLMSRRRADTCCIRKFYQRNR